MLVAKNRFIFLATPRTGSRALISALGTLKDTRKAKTHHVHPEDVATEAESLYAGSKSLPIVTIIRNPYHQMLSWFGHAVLRNDASKATSHDFASFIKTYMNSWLLADRLNPYAKMDRIHFFTFHPTSLRSTLNDLIKRSNCWNGTYDQATQLSKVGGTSTPPSQLLTVETRGLIAERFPEDIELWQHQR